MEVKEEDPFEAFPEGYVHVTFFMPNSIFLTLLKLFFSLHQYSDPSLIRPPLKHYKLVTLAFGEGDKFTLFCRRPK
jgi:hypothetical protein